MKIQNTKTIENPTINILIYGESGTGKTTFAGSSNADFKPLFLSAEKGLLSIKDLGVDYIQIDTFDDFVSVSRDIKLGKLEQYNTIVLDSLTALQRLCLRYVTGDDVADFDDVKQAKMQDWGKLSALMEKILVFLRNLDKNLIVTCLAEYHTNENTMETKILPQLQGSLRQNVAAIFDEVFYSFTVEKTGEDGKQHTKYGICTANTGKSIGKDRSGKLPKVIYDASFSSVYNEIHKQKEEQ